MPTAEIDLPDRIDTDIESLIQQDEFVNRDQAVEELLSLGLSAYGPAETESDEPGGDLFNQRVEDQQDPATREGPDDEPMF